MLNPNQLINKSKYCAILLRSVLFSRMKLLFKIWCAMPVMRQLRTVIHHYPTILDNATVKPPVTEVMCASACSAQPKLMSPTKTQVTPLQFQSMLRRKAQQPVALAELLTDVSPASIPGLFSNALEVDLLLSVINGLSELLRTQLKKPGPVDNWQPHVLSIMEALSLLPRFDMTVSFFSACERAAVDKLGTIDPTSNCT